MFEPVSDWAAQLPDPPVAGRLADLEVATLLPQDLRRSLAWTLLLADREEEIESYASGVRWFRHAAIGFLSPEFDYDVAGFPPFGVILYADPDDDADAARGPVGLIESAGQSFAVVVRRGRYSEHAVGHPQVQGGSVAYWSTSRGGKHSGWLTAGHVTEEAAFKLAGHGVLDRASHCIDAAVVDINDYRSSLTHVPAFAALTPGLQISMACAPGKKATVLDVAANLRISRSWRFPLRFSTSQTGRKGDSGSAIEEALTHGQSPLGIYLGSFQPDTPPPGHAGAAGFALAIWQLEQLMGLEVFR